MSGSRDGKRLGHSPGAVWRPAVLCAALAVIGVTPPGRSQPTDSGSSAFAAVASEMEASLPRLRADLLNAASTLETLAVTDSENEAARDEVFDLLLRRQDRYRSVALNAIKTRLLAHREDPERMRREACSILLERRNRFSQADRRERIQQIQSRIEEAGGSDEGEATWRGDGKGRLRLAYLDLSAAFEVSAALTPSRNCLAVARPSGWPIGPELEAERVSASVRQLRFLASILGGLDPNNVPEMPGVDRNLTESMYAAEQEIALEELRRIVVAGVFVDPRTNTRILAGRRQELAGLIEANLADYLSKVSERTFVKDLFWYDDSRAALAERIRRDIRSNPAYMAAAYLDSGLEPDIRQFFRAAALAIRADRERAATEFRESLGDGFWQTSLGQLVRANDEYWSAENSTARVAERLDSVMAEMEIVARAFDQAAETEADELDDATYELLNGFGYILEYDAGDGTRERTYQIPGTRSGLGARLSRTRASLALPGGSVLDMVTPELVAITIVSTVAPEVGAYWLGSAAATLGLGRRGVIALRLFTETAIGTAIDASYEYLKNDGRVDYERLVLESVVLGNLLQVTGALSTQSFEVVMDGLARAERQTQLYGFLEKALRAKPERTKELYELAGAAWGLGHEVGVAYAFQKYVEGQEVDLTALQCLVVNSSLTRIVSSKRMSVEEAIADRSVPGWLREGLLALPVLRREVRDRIISRLERERATRERLEAMVREERNVPDAVFNSLLRGDFSWSDIKQIAADAPELLGAALPTVARYREAFFSSLVGEAKLRAVAEINRVFDLREQRVVEQNANAEDRRRLLAELQQRRQSELDAVMAHEDHVRARKEIERRYAELAAGVWADDPGVDTAVARIRELDARRQAELDALGRKPPVAPGSSDPTSDIDRSSSSAYLRRHLRGIYEQRARQLLGEGIDVPTSAGSFDVNEYINVFPFIVDNRRFFSQLKRQTHMDRELGIELPYGDLMEAITLSAPMKNMDDAQIELYVANERRALESRIEDLPPERQSALRRTFEEQVTYARQSIARSRARLEGYKQRIAQERGWPKDGFDTEIEALDRMYDIRMRELADLQFELSEIEAEHLRAGGSESSFPDAILQKRLELERKMNVALRDGIETYAYTVGLDIVVNQVQAARKPDGSRMTESDLLFDYDFSTDDSLSLYGAQEGRGIVRDQIMHMMHHVNAFNTGHESSYLTGRALGKYLMRAFLGLKVGGLDVARVKEAPESDPTRRLLEVAENLLARKKNPKEIDRYLASIARQAPGTPEHGLTEVFHLMEQVLPGMDGLTGVMPGWRTASAETRGHRHRAARLAALALARRQRREMKLAGGAKRSVQATRSELEHLDLEISAHERELQSLREIAAEHLSPDAARLRRLFQQRNGLEQNIASLIWPDPESATYRGQTEMLERVEAEIRRLEAAERPPPPDDQISADPANHGFRRHKDRLEWLELKRSLLREELAALEEEAARVARFDALDLTGDWSCTFPGGRPWTGPLTQEGLELRLELSAPSRDQPGPHLVLDAERSGDRIFGVWEDRTSLTEHLVPGWEATNTRMLFEARLDESGRQFAFLDVDRAPKHPRTGLDVAGSICRRKDAGEPGTADYVTSSTGSLPPEVDAADDETRGLLRVTVRTPSGEVRQIDFRVFRGSRPRAGSGQLWLPPGTYDLRTAVGGREVREQVEVGTLQMTTVVIHPGALDLLDRSAVDGSEEGLLQVFEQGRSDSPWRTSWSSSSSVLLPPGDYRLLVSGGEAGPFYELRVDGLRAGEARALELDWASVLVRNDRGGPDPEVLGWRLAVDQTGAGQWRPIDPARLSSRDGGTVLTLPPGDYELRFQRAGEIHSRAVSVTAGQQLSIEISSEVD